jgi:hypothetical protein
MDWWLGSLRGAFILEGVKYGLERLLVGSVGGNALLIQWGRPPCHFGLGCHLAVFLGRYHLSRN